MIPRNINQSKNCPHPFTEPNEASPPLFQMQWLAIFRLRFTPCAPTQTELALGTTSIPNIPRPLSQVLVMRWQGLESASLAALARSTGYGSQVVDPYWVLRQHDFICHHGRLSLYTDKEVNATGTDHPPLHHDAITTRNTISSLLLIPPTIVQSPP